MFSRHLFTHVGVLKTELVAAVVAYCHGCWPKADYFDLVWVARLGRVRVVAAMDRDERGSHDRVWTVWTHPLSIGSLASPNKPSDAFDSGMAPTN